MSSLTVRASLRLGSFDFTMDEEIPAEGISAIFGPSGSGKTTLLRVIAGLERARDAEIRFGDTIWQGSGQFVPPHRRRIGYVFQDARLFTHLNVERNLRFALPHSKATFGFEDVVEAFELDAFLNRGTDSLSGGEAQRVAIARALLSGPRLLLMDEPLSSLDVARKKEILPHIESLPDRFGIPVVYVTHDTDELVRVADYVLLLSNGQAAARGEVKEIFDRIDTRTILGTEDGSSVLDVEVQSFSDGMTTLSIGRQALRVPGTLETLGAHSRIRISARDVVVATRPVENLSIRNTLECTLAGIESGGEFEAELLLDVDSQRLRARITRNALEDLNLREGTAVYALIKSVAVDPNL